MQDSNNDNVTPLEELEKEDVIEMILSRYPSIDLDEFIAGNYDLANMCKFSWNREELCLLANRYHNKNCLYSYYAVYHDLMILYLALLRGNKKMDIETKKNINKTNNGIEDDILNEFPIILDESISMFNIIENYSLKSFFKKKAINYIRAIKNKDRRQRMVGKSKTKNNYNQAMLDIDEEYIEEYLPYVDMEKAILETMIEDSAKKVIRSCIKKEYFKTQDFRLFCIYYGLLGEEPKGQKEIAKEYNISIPSVSLKIKKVKDVLRGEKEIKELGKIYGIGVGKNN